MLLFECHGDCAPRCSLMSSIEKIDHCILFPFFKWVPLSVFQKNGRLNCDCNLFCATLCQRLIRLRCDGNVLFKKWSPDDILCEKNKEIKNEHNFEGAVAWTQNVNNENNKLSACYCYFQTLNMGVRVKGAKEMKSRIELMGLTDSLCGRCKQKGPV